MQQQDDILAAFDLTGETEKQEEIKASHDIKSENFGNSFDTREASEVSINDEITQIEIKQKRSFLQSAKDSIIFAIKYMTTSLCIFAVLMVAANYSAYWNLAYSFIYAEEMKQTKQSLIKSVAAAEIGTEENAEKKENMDTFRELRKIEEKKWEKLHDMSALIQKDEVKLDLWIEITPYENRIIIPKIGKNIPLLDIKQTTVEGVDELNNIFMDELENGVVRYPGSAKPGENGNAFIFGHSSNNVWEKGEYNDVFALLDHVIYDDEVIVYYGQEKHTYKIKTKNVIRPWDVSVLESDKNDDKSQITLMTCWPIGTTLNRLILTGELIHVEK